MSKFLTQEWLDETRGMADSQPERPGATARMQYIVTGTPDGDVHYYWVVENGKLLDSQLGDVADADFSMSMTYDDALKIQRLELDANAAFMQGRIKVNGNMAKLMSLMPITNSPEYRGLMAEIDKITDY